MSMRSITSLTDVSVSDKPWITQSLKSSNKYIVNDRSYLINMKKTLTLTSIGVIKYKEMLNLHECS